MRLATIIVTGIASLAIFSSFAQAQDPFDVTHCYVGTASVVFASDDAAIINFEHKGIYRSNHEKKLFDGFAIHCGGTNVTLNKKAAIRGGCKILDSKGDMIAAVFEGAAGDRGTAEIVAGTGAWKGITGSGDWKVQVSSKPLSAGAFQACLRYFGTVTLRN